jgi:hypothetical protein
LTIPKTFTMRIILLLLFFTPFLGNSQVNRSANQLAGERVKEFIEQKLFRELDYTAVRSGELKPYNNPMSLITWTFEHEFLIESPVFADKKTSQTKAYRFSFYLDKRMKVLKAESYHLE